MPPTPSNGAWNCSTARRARTSRGRAPLAAPMPAGCRRSSPERGAASTCSTFAPRPAAPGSAIDATEAETMRSALARMVDAHRRTLDQLSTGVAMFDAEHRLTFYNAAYRALWNLDASYLDQGPTDFGGARRVAGRPQAARGAGLPAMEGAAAHRLQRRRGEGADLASARRPHIARRHHAQSGRRRHLSVQRRDRAARSGAAVRGTDPRARRNARQPRRRRRRVRQRRPHPAVQFRLRPHVAAVAASSGRAAAYRNDHGAMPAVAWRRRHLAGAAPGGDRDRQPRGDRGTARTARRQRGRLHGPCRCRTAPHW